MEGNGEGIMQRIGQVDRDGGRQSLRTRLVSATGAVIAEGGDSRLGPSRASGLSA
jgi:hypothetical protein